MSSWYLEYFQILWSRRHHGGFIGSSPRRSGHWLKGTERAIAIVDLKHPSVGFSYSHHFALGQLSHLVDLATSNQFNYKERKSDRDRDWRNELFLFTLAFFFLRMPTLSPYSKFTITLRHLTQPVHLILQCIYSTVDLSLSSNNLCRVWRSQWTDFGFSSFFLSFFFFLATSWGYWHLPSDFV